jgi:hypothetical protein
MATAQWTTNACAANMARSIGLCGQVGTNAFRDKLLCAKGVKEAIEALPGSARGAALLVVEPAIIESHFKQLNATEVCFQDGLIKKLYGKHVEPIGLAESHGSVTSCC